MKWSLILLSVIALLDQAVPANAKTPKNPQPVIPAVLYGNNLFIHYRDTTRRQPSYIIEVRPINSPNIKIAFHQGSPRNDFESLFVRGPVLVVGVNLFIPSRNPADGDTSSYDTVKYVSPDQLCDAKWVHVEPSGKPVTVADGQSYPIMWERRIDLPIPLSDFAPGDAEIKHTAVAAAGDRNLLVFDLIRIVPAKGKPAQNPKIAVTRLTPEARARMGEGFNVGEPEEKDLDEVQSEFSEPFQAYLIGDDYYFLTKSGSVYRSVPPAKGKPRSMTAVWTKPKERVAYIISDGERPGVHFLITARDKAGWHYFRLGPEPKLQLLSNAKGGPHDNMDPSDVIWELAIILKRKKEIGTAPAKP